MGKVALWTPRHGFFQHADGLGDWALLAERGPRCQPTGACIAWSHSIRVCIILPSTLKIAQIKIRPAPTTIGIYIIGIKLDGALEVRQGMRVIAHVEIDKAAMTVGPGIAGVKLNGAIKIRQRVIIHTQVAIDATALAIAPDIGWIEFGSAVIILDSTLIVSKAEVSVTA